jgi:hypothetical protein
VLEALRGKREEIRARFPWEPSHPGAEGVSAEKAAAALAATPATAAQAPSIGDRLMAAKERARKEFEKK